MEQQPLDQGRARLQAVERLKDGVGELRDRLATLEARMPAQPAEDELINTLQSYADLTGMGSFILVCFGERRPGDGYVEMP